MDDVTPTGKGRARPVCPSCGYDLTGVAAGVGLGPGAAVDRAAAGEASTLPGCAPLVGRCSECGVYFSWGEVLGPNRPPGWSFEHHRDRPFERLAGTLARSATPGRMWRELRLGHSFEGRRLLTYAVLGVLLAHGAVCLGALGVSLAWPDAVWRARGWITGRPTWVDVLGSSVWPYRMSVGWGSWVWVNVWFAWGVLTTAIMPAGVALMPSTLHPSRMRWRHVWRVWTYSFPLLPLVCGSWMALGGVLAWMKRLVDGRGGGTGVAGGVFSTGRPSPGGAATGLSWEGFSLVLGRAIGVHSWAFGVVFAAWLWWWWRAAAKRYLRAEMPGVTAALLVLMSSMFAAVLLSSIPGVMDVWREAR
ncbi:MAG: hypothetical protein JNM07_10645 [Phycisphaerae bacterium]|nr:hypothetical protein [Phycisphaerae bacterium]